MSLRLMGINFIALLLCCSFYNSVIALDLNYQRCLRATGIYEKLYALPPGLLHSVTVAESGKWNKYHERVLPHPWTLNVEGKPYYFSSKDEAVRFLKRVIDSGIENVDIGCAQISWKYHGKSNFKKPEDVLNPNFNVAYAAYFLAQNFSETRNWNKAIAIYHSRTERGASYSERVRNIWRSNKNNEISKLLRYKIVKNKLENNFSALSKNDRSKQEQKSMQKKNTFSKHPVKSRPRDDQGLLVFTNNNQNNPDFRLNNRVMILP